MDTPHPPNCPDLLLHLTCQYFVEIACPEPNIPKHTQRNRKLSAIGFAEGTTLHYGCSSGYETTNPLNIRCQSNGQWTSTPPVCKGECGWGWARHPRGPQCPPPFSGPCLRLSMKAPIRHRRCIYLILYTMTCFLF
jgi:hypothetical protein